MFLVKYELFLNLAKQIAKMGNALLFSIVLARVLGPTISGDFFYVYALYGVLLFVSNAGMEQLFSVYLSKYRKNTLNIVNAGLKFRFYGAVISFGFLIFLSSFILSKNLYFVAYVISLLYFLNIRHILEYYFYANNFSSKSSLAYLFSYFLGFIFKFIAVFEFQSLIYVAFAFLFESLLISLLLSLLYSYDVRKNAEFFEKVRSHRKDRFLLNKALPLIISSGLVLLYMKVDQIMLGYFSESASVAIYTAGLRLTEAWYFIAITVVNLYFPKSLSINKKSGKLRFIIYLSKVSRVFIAFSFALILFVYIAADNIIRLLYGVDFMAASHVLLISIFCVPLVYFGSLGTRLLLHSGNGKQILYRSIFALLLNISLNIILIPSYGANGAAFATLVSQFFVGIIFNVFKTRDFNSVLVRMLSFSKL